MRFIVILICLVFFSVGEKEIGVEAGEAPYHSCLYRSGFLKRDWHYSPNSHQKIWRTNDLRTSALLEWVHPKIIRSVCTSLQVNWIFWTFVSWNFPNFALKIKTHFQCLFISVIFWRTGTVTKNLEPKINKI